MTIDAMLSTQEICRIIAKGDDASIKEIKNALRSLWADVENAKETGK